MKKLSLTLLTAALAGFTPRAARADTIGFTTTGGGLGSNYRAITIGYTFTLANSVSVTQLGYWNYQGDGLTNAVPVTIWNGSGVAQATATVPAGTNAGEINQYLYVTLATPVTLAAGTYTIGGYNTSSFDPFQTNLGTITGATGITYGAPRSASGNTYPAGDTMEDGGNSYFGPNFEIAGGVPEPGTWAMLGVGVAGLGFVTLRRRRARLAWVFFHPVTPSTMKPRFCSFRFLALAGATTLLLAAVPERVHADNLYVANPNSSSVSEFNASTGATISDPLPAATNVPFGLSLVGNTLYAANYANNTVGAYDATTGAAAGGFTTINTGANTRPFDVLASGGMLYVSTYKGNTVSAYNAATGAASTTFATLTGLINPSGLGILGTTLYVSNEGTGAIETFNAQTGALLNASFLAGFAGVDFLTVAGTTLYVSDGNANLVKAFDATTGLALPTFTTITGASSPEGVKVSGNVLYVSDFNNDRVSEYNATTGAVINANFASVVNGPEGLAIGSVPEPSTWAMLGVGVAGLGVVTLRRRARLA